MLNNFYQQHFLLQCVFLAVSSPKVNLLSHFSTLAPQIHSWGDRHTHPLTFCKKFNAQQFLFESFIVVMHIFGSVEP